MNYTFEREDGERFRLNACDPRTAQREAARRFAGIPGLILVHHERRLIDGLDPQGRAAYLNARNGGQYHR